MLRLLIVLVISAVCVLGQVAWLDKARIPDATRYFSKIIQEMIFDVEKMEWCNLKVDDYSQTINDQLYSWHVNGTVTYTNGFVVAIQSMDVTNMEQQIYSSTVQGVVTPFATVSGRLNMNHVTIGHDVLVNLTNQPQQRYTGQYTHTLIQIILHVTKNLFTGEITTSHIINNLSAEIANRMIYMPANNVTEALSRRYMPSNNWDAVTRWSRQIFGPILVDIAFHRIQFPEICFANCPA